MSVQSQKLGVLVSVGAANPVSIIKNKFLRLVTTGRENRGPFQTAHLFLFDTGSRTLHFRQLILARPMNETFVSASNWPKITFSQAADVSFSVAVES